jgi:hypothetical protein
MYAILKRHRNSRIPMGLNAKCGCIEQNEELDWKGNNILVEM